MKRLQRLLLSLLILISVFTVLPTEALALNQYYGRPPTLTLLVYGAAEDTELRVIMHRGGKTYDIPFEHERRLWEDQYRLYREAVWQFREWYGNAYDFKDAELVFTNASGQWRVPIPDGMLTERADEEYLTYYCRSGRLRYGLALWRAPLLMSIRVLLAILIESFFFYRAGYCLRKIWISFVLINVVTHGLLALLCNGWINVQPGSFALYYIALFLAFVLETVLFVLIVNEQDSNRAASFLAKANAVSLLATFLLIFVLPI